MYRNLCKPHQEKIDEEPPLLRAGYVPVMHRAHPLRKWVDLEFSKLEKHAHSQLFT
jgi:hypothetical protein